MGMFLEELWRCHTEYIVLRCLFPPSVHMRFSDAHVTGIPMRIENTLMYRNVYFAVVNREKNTGIY